MAKLTVTAERERIRDMVAEQVRNPCLPGGEYIKTLEQLREVLRVPEGEDVVTHAKVVRALADALISLQK